MDSQTPSYNPKNRNLKINSEVLQPLEGLDEILYNMVGEIIKKGEIHNASGAFIYTRMVELGHPKSYIHYARISVLDDKNRTVASCESIESISSPGKITCRNLEKDKPFEISNDYLSKIRDALRNISNVIYWGDPTRKNLAEELGLSTHERKSLTPSHSSEIYANINLTKRLGKPTIEIYENPHCLDSGMIRYNKEGSKIDVHYRFL